MLKIKRAVCCDYMDLSTPDLREKMIRCELVLNKPIAPEIHRTVILVTSAADGRLALNGDAMPVMRM